MYEKEKKKVVQFEEELEKERDTALLKKKLNIKTDLVPLQ